MAKSWKTRVLEMVIIRRRELFRKLGDKCIKCGSLTNLEFHHIKGISWSHTSVSRWTRIKRYEEEAEQGLIEILCSTCNKKVGNPRQKEEDEVPF